MPAKYRCSVPNQDGVAVFKEDEHACMHLTSLYDQKLIVQYARVSLRHATSAYIISTVYTVRTVRDVLSYTSLVTPKLISTS